MNLDGDMNLDGILSKFSSEVRESNSMQGLVVLIQTLLEQLQVTKEQLQITRRSFRSFGLLGAYGASFEKNYLHG